MNAALHIQVCKLGEKNQIEELRDLIKKTSVKEVRRESSIVKCL